MTWQSVGTRLRWPPTPGERHHQPNGGKPAERERGEHRWLFLRLPLLPLACFVLVAVCASYDRGHQDPCERFHFPIAMQPRAQHTDANADEHEKRARPSPELRGCERQATCHCRKRPEDYGDYALPVLRQNFTMQVPNLKRKRQEPTRQYQQNQLVTTRHECSIPLMPRSGILCDPMAERCIGVDESGKGDYFGPLVVAACYVGREHLAELEDVRESKRVTDAQCLRLAGRIRAVCPHKIVLIPPLKYNKFHDETHNLNRMLAWAHARAIEDLLERYPEVLSDPTPLKAISDQFAKPDAVTEKLFELGKRVQFESRVRAESVMCVAAASLLARATFLYKLKDLSDKWAVTLPKGAGREVIRAGRAFVAKHGKARLSEVAKVHFRTTESVLQAG